MHELLAHVLWVVQTDAIDLGQASRTLGEDAVISFVFDSAHVEHDSFAIFGQIMQSSKTFYVSEGPESIATRSHHISNELLPLYDPALAEHLTNLDVVPQIYLIRWIRLLFGREFEMNDVLALWDVLFAEDQTLEIANYIAIAMLLRVRWHLLEGDYNTVLGILLKYPHQGPEFPAQSLLLDALYLQTHRDTRGASVLVLKYTGRPLLQPGRPATPPALQRNITTFSGFSIPRSPRIGFSPPRASRQTRNIEAILQNTAKNIYAQSEKLGIGKAVRNAVDEVHRKAQEIRDVQTPASPAWRRQSGLRTDDKIRELEERNRQLSALLTEAVSEMWEHQKIIGDSIVDTEKTAAVVGDSVDKLGAAIAKVQFVQVYLDDPTLVLPLEDTGDLDVDTNTASDMVIAASQIEQESSEVNIKEKDAIGIEDPFINEELPSRGPESGARARPLADPSSFEDALATPLELPEAPLAALRTNLDTGLPSPADSTILSVRNVTSSTHVKGAESKRPPLEQSAFSFILGQDAADEQRRGLSSSKDASQTPGRAKVSLFGETPGRGKSPRAAVDGDGFVDDKDDFDIGSLRRAKGPK
jgi:TBC1 domain family protein 5